MNKIQNTMKMLHSVNQLKAMGMTETDVKNQLVNQILTKAYTELMANNKPNAGKEASDMCNELLSVVKRVYHPEEE